MTDYGVGLNGLKGFNITTFKISLTPNPDGSNLVGIVYVPNTSVMTLDLVKISTDSQDWF